MTGKERHFLLNGNSVWVNGKIIRPDIGLFSRAEIWYDHRGQKVIGLRSNVGHTTEYNLSDDSIQISHIVNPNRYHQNDKLAKEETNKFPTYTINPSVYLRSWLGGCLVSDLYPSLPCSNLGKIWENPSIEGSDIINIQTTGKKLKKRGRSFIRQVDLLTGSKSQPIPVEIIRVVIENPIKGKIIYCLEDQDGQSNYEQFSLHSSYPEENIF